MSLGFYPSCLGYGGFPKSMAISVNEVVCHSIPDSTELVDGDIVKVDLGCHIDGYIAVAANTIVVPSDSMDEVKKAEIVGQE